MAAGGAAVGNGSDITGVFMLWQKEFLEQAIHLQQGFAVEQDLIALNRHESPILQALNAFGETLGEFDAKFLFEIRAADMAELQLQNELAQNPFFSGGRQCPPDREVL